MVRNNNMIPCGHFHKDWQNLIRVKLNQPMRKKMRGATRANKIRKTAPKPVDHLRPVVSCPSIRYHTKARLGRGFTAIELKACKIHPKYARTIGIAVDKRRRNKSVEGLKRNIARLTGYLNKFEDMTKKKGQVVKSIHLCNGIVDEKNGGKEKARKVTDDEKKFKAFETLRKARTEKQKLRKKLKRKEKEITFEFGK